MKKLVACPKCKDCAFIIDADAETTECRNCEKQTSVRKLRVFVESDDDDRLEAGYTRLVQTIRNNDPLDKFYDTDYDPVESAERGFSSSGL